MLYSQLAKNGLFLWNELVKNGSLLWNECIKNGEWLWDDLKHKTSLLLNYVDANWGPAFCSVRQWCQLRWQDIMTYGGHIWDLCKPYFDHIVSVLLHYTDLVVAKTKEHLPIFIDSVSGQINDLWA